MFKIQKGYESISKSFRLPSDMVETLEQIAAENHLSLNQLVIQCLQYSLDNLEGFEENKK